MKYIIRISAICSTGSDIKHLAQFFSVAVMALSVHAAVVDSSFSYSMDVTEINQTGSFNPLGSTLGNLIYAKLSVFSTNLASGTLKNTAAQAKSVSAVTVTDDSPRRIHASAECLDQFANPLVVLNTTTCPDLLATGAQLSAGQLRGSQSIVWTSQLNSILASFVQPGAGSFQVSRESVSGQSLRGGGGNINPARHIGVACSTEINFISKQRRQQVPNSGALTLTNLALAALARRPARATRVTDSAGSSELGILLARSQR